MPAKTCRVNIEHQMLGGSGVAIEGVEKASTGSSSKEDAGLDVDKAGKMA